jgi:GNAT superfamily N-acetyltransferase
MFEVKRFTNQELPWPTVGPLFCAREVHRELGTAVTTDKSYTWFLAFKDGNLAGFAAVEAKAGKAMLRHAYVLPQYRGNGVYRLLLEAREAFVAQNPSLMLMETTAAPDSYKALKAAGWADHRQRGKYVVMHKEVRRE